jgi:hypothetical protein
MAIEIPKPIADYFLADLGNGQSVAECFTTSGTVLDENQLHTGKSEIAAWKEAASKRFNYIATPISISKDGEDFIVVATVAGDFPSSPITLRYKFQLEANKISSLEVLP